VTAKTPVLLALFIQKQTLNGIADVLIAIKSFKPLSVTSNTTVAPNVVVNFLIHKESRMVMQF
jgi:hypothetical protein